MPSWSEQPAPTTVAHSGANGFTRRVYERSNAPFTSDADRTPVYVQWLITPPDKRLLDQHDPGYWPPLKDDEVLLEFAYTFTPFRGLGVMTDAMGQLLRVGAALGAKSALTYVLSDNIPSLRGCAKVGFDLDHVKAVSRRLGVHRSEIRPSSDADLQCWQQATAP